MDYYFQTEQICVGYQGIPLIENITIEAGKGEILTLIGPNGAGKSTILKSIARQLALLGGIVRLDGQDIAGLSGNELSRKMAVVFTEKLRTEMMTCRDVVATGRYPYTGRFGNRDFCAWGNVYLLFRKMSSEQLFYGKGCESGGMYPSVPLEVCGHGGKPSGRISAGV